IEDGDARVVGNVRREGRITGGSRAATSRIRCERIGVAVDAEVVTVPGHDQAVWKTASRGPVGRGDAVAGAAGRRDGMSRAAGIVDLDELVVRAAWPPHAELADDELSGGRRLRPSRRSGEDDEQHEGYERAKFHEGFETAS